MLPSLVFILRIPSGAENTISIASQFCSNVVIVDQAFPSVILFTNSKFLNCCSTSLPYRLSKALVDSSANPNKVTGLGIDAGSPS